MAAVRRAAGEAIPISAGPADRAQCAGFADPRSSGRVDGPHLRRTIDRVGVLQVDSVNVLCRSHYLPLFARLGPYSRTTLDRPCWSGGDDRQLFEYFWGLCRCSPLNEPQRRKGVTIARKAAGSSIHGVWPAPA